VSFCYDTMAKAWATLAQQLPEEVQAGELATYFEFLISEMHEANHRAGDVINKDARVSATARKLDLALKGAHR